MKFENNKNQRDWCPKISEGPELFVIGDIHGCSDQFKELIDRLPLKPGARLVFIGDFIDRGPDSREVINTVIELQQRFEVHALMGNHESSLLEFLANPSSTLAARFLFNGGTATLQSYSDAPGRFGFPTEHLDFIKTLNVAAESEQYFFVHAGLPNVKISDLKFKKHRNDLLWIRDSFLASSFNWEKRVVHGHTPRAQVEVFPGRINIDTGCVYDNLLTALHLPSMKLYQVRKKKFSGHIFLEEETGSRRRAVRFDGVVPVSLASERAVFEFETVNYNDFGMLIKGTDMPAAPLFSEGDEIDGKITPDDELGFTFRGTVVRIERVFGDCRYAIKFTEPPISDDPHDTPLPMEVEDD